MSNQPSYTKIENFLTDLMGATYMRVPREDVPKYHKKVVKFIKSCEASK